MTGRKSGWIPEGGELLAGRQVRGPAHAGVAAAGAPLAARDPDCTNTMRILTGTPALGFNESIHNNHKVDR